MAQIEEFNEIEELAQFRKLWRALLAETENGSFFQSLEWLEVLWKHTAGTPKLRVLIVSADGEAIGIVPLAIYEKPTRMGTLRYLGFPEDNWATASAPVGPHPLISMKAALRHIGRTPRDWDVLELQKVPEGPTTVTPIAGALCKSGFPVEEETCDQIAVIDIAGTFQRYWNCRGRELKLETELQEDAMCDGYQLQHLRYRVGRKDAEQSTPCFDVFDTCQKIAEPSTTSEDAENFANEWDLLRDVFESACRAGSIDVNLLQLDDRPIAFDFNVHFEGHVNVVRSGCATATEGIDPTSVLRRKWIADSFQRLDRTIDLGSVKCDAAGWGTKVVDTYRYKYVPRMSIRARLLQLNDWAWRKTISKSIG